jgi:cyclopropane-fatty-acyl-phospholipid synthase
MPRLADLTARKLDIWARALQEHRDEAIAAQSEEVYARYMRYMK